MERCGLLIAERKGMVVTDHACYRRTRGWEGELRGLVVGRRGQRVMMALRWCEAHAVRRRREVAEQRALPAAEAVVGHRHRQRTR